MRINTSSRSITVGWEFSAYELQNGPITQYVVQVQSMVNSHYGNTQSVIVNVNNVTFPDRETHQLVLTDKGHMIEVGRRYRVRIAARNINGTGPFTDWFTTQTSYEGEFV